MTSVVGGVYSERCVEPFWDDVYGSGGRAAAAMSGACPDVRLVTYRAELLLPAFDSLASAYGFTTEGPVVGGAVGFEYMHSLAVPRITPRPDAIAQQAVLEIDDDVVLRFGMLEGTAKVTARTAVYDPQSAFDPRPYRENGSTAERLALILNRQEARKLSGSADPEEAIDRLMRDEDAEVIVLKMGGHGALVASGGEIQRVPAYRSPAVWKIGSGDVFSAAFTQFWAIEQRSAVEAADLASRATSEYCGTRALPFASGADLAALELEPVRPAPGMIYIAAPFFNLAERWLVEEIRDQLLGMGVDVFSPFHDVGPGDAQYVAPLDLDGLRRCDAVLAVLNGNDAGTIFEVGYANALGKPVVALAQNMRPEDLKMPEGSGCRLANDLVSAVYQAVWSLT